MENTFVTMLAASHPAPRRRVLVSRLDSMGDVLLTGPAVRAVAAQADVVFLTSPRGAAAASVLPGVDDVIVHEATWIAAEPPPVRRRSLDHLVDQVTRARVDAACILGSSHQSPLPLALLLRLAGVEPITAISHEYPGSLLDQRIAGDPDVHEVERNLLVVERAGFALPDGDDDRLRVNASPAPPVDVPPGTVVVHPGASVPARTWPADRWRHLVAKLVGAGRTVLVTGQLDERELVGFVAVSGARPVVGVDLADVASIIGTAEILVSGNTGPVHLAAAMGTPVVEIFAPTVPADRWAPWRVRYVLLGDTAIDCAGCRQRVCPKVGQPCIGTVGDTEVLDAVELLTGLEAISGARA